jgi:excisionase family DNA binding protein
MREIMTTAELANYLKLHEITIWKHAAAGKIPSIRVGRLWRFDKAAIDKWIRAGGRNTSRYKSKAKSTKHILRKRSHEKGKTKSR